MTLIGILHALGSRSAILSLALAPWLLTIGCDHGARPSGGAEEGRDVGDGTPGAQSQPSGGAHDTLPEDTIGFEFAVFRRGSGDVTLAEYVGVLRRHLKGEPFFEVVRITAEDDRAVRIWVKPLTRDYAEIDEFLRGIVQPRALEFRILAYRSAEDPGKHDQVRRRLRENRPEPGAGDEYGWFKIDDPVTFFDLGAPDRLTQFGPENTELVVEKRADDFFVLAELSSEYGLLASDESWSVRLAYVAQDQLGRLCVDIELNEAGARLLEDLTRKNIGRALCILVDTKAISAPRVQTVVRERARITGDFSREQALELSGALQARAGPLRLKFVRRID